MHVFLVLVCQLVRRKLILTLLDVVGLNHSAEDWKPIFDVEGCIIAIGVYSCSPCLVSMAQAMVCTVSKVSISTTMLAHLQPRVLCRSCQHFLNRAASLLNGSL